MPSISWGPSTQYDTGSDLAVAMDNAGNVIEVHRSSKDERKDHYYLVGKVDFDKKTIKWGPSRKYDTGTELAVAMDNRGNVVEIHRGYHETKDHYYRVGRLDVGQKSIEWGESRKFDTGRALAVALDDYGHVVDVHRGFHEWEDRYYILGKLDTQNKTILWGDTVKYGSEGGRGGGIYEVAVAMDDLGNVVELHTKGSDAHNYSVGKIDESSQTIDWRSGGKYDTGSSLAVAMDNHGNVVNVHQGFQERSDLYYKLGRLDPATRTISWSDSHKYDRGRSFAVAMNDSGGVVEVHQGNKDPRVHYYRVGELRS